MTLQGAVAVGTVQPDFEGRGVLAAHLQFCTAAMGTGFRMRCMAEAVHGVVAPRFVTTVCLSCALLFGAMLVL